MMDKFSISFRFEKETKNTYKYEERPESGQPPRIGTLYLKKWAFGGKAPETITLHIEVADEREEPT